MTENILKSSTEMQMLFSGIAARYDCLNTILTLSIDKSWRRRAVDLCRLQKGQKVLDLCCGTGQMMELICREVGKDTTVTGLDLTERMLEVGKQRLGEAISDYSYRLVRGNVLDCPFEDASFDCVTIAFGLRSIPDKERALTEIARILKPGGRIVCLELSKPEAPILRSIYNLYFNHFLPIIGAIGTRDKAAYAYLRDSVNGFYTKEELLEAFHGVGFTDTGFMPMTCGAAAVHYGYKSYGYPFFKQHKA